MNRLLAGAVAALALTACSVQVPTNIPTPTPTATTTAKSPVSCQDAAQTYAALSPLPAPGAMPKGTILDALSGRGRLIVGVVSDQRPLGWRDPIDGKFKGFETELQKALAKALTGDETKVEIRVIRAANAAQMLSDQSVDVVMAGTPMTCDGWNTAAFSAPYLHVEQRLLGRRGTDLVTVANRTVCTVEGSPYGGALAGAKNLTAPTATACLAKLQAGTVDLVSDARPVLAGLATQDPFVEVSEAPLSQQWDYAVMVSKDRPLLTQFVSGVIAAYVADGRWQAAYDQWLKPSLGAGAAPAPQYGRKP